MPSQRGISRIGDTRGMYALVAETSAGRVPFQIILDPASCEHVADEILRDAEHWLERIDPRLRLVRKADASL